MYIYIYIYIKVANRDPEVFPEPGVFNPCRENLNYALTWNGGAFQVDDEKLYPRICPGRYLALDVAKCVIDHFVSASAYGSPTA